MPEALVTMPETMLVRATAIVATVATVTISSDAGGAEGTGGIDAAGTEGTGGRINYDSGCNQCVWEWFYASKKLLRAWAIGAIVAIVLIDADAGGAEGIGGCKIYKSG
ncbi:hypothetical protein GGX14DRAFT_393996 [Mycena pura]|uniref:Uncharacterized protein n=1 Tax=Mycena pura TaxID=153505 RepID=A0AAD6YBE4_9AGAR|nr:hypothetical protein GGX14DRAFT_393996 [Mycena pura]